MLGAIACSVYFVGEMGSSVGIMADISTQESHWQEESIADLLGYNFSGDMNVLTEDLETQGNLFVFMFTFD